MEALKAPGVRFGLIVGGVYVVIMAVLFSSGVKVYKSAFAMLPFWIMIALGVVAGLQERKINGGFITFGRAVITVQTVFIISEFMINALDFTLYNFVDPELHQKIKEYTVATTAETIERFSGVVNYQENDIEELMDTVKNANYHFKRKDALMKFVTWCVIDAIFALIIGIIIRKEPKATISEHEYTN